MQDKNINYTQLKPEAAKLYDLFVLNNTKIAGITKGLDAWHIFIGNNQSFLEKNTTFFVDKSNFIYTPSGKTLYLNNTGLQQVQQFLSNANRSEYKNRKTATPELKELVTKLLTEHLKTQTYLTSLMQMLGIISGNVISNMFCQSYSNCFYKDSENVLYLTLSKHIGLMVMHFVMAKVEQNMSALDLGSNLGNPRDDFFYHFISGLFALDVFTPKMLISIFQDSKNIEKLISFVLKTFGLETKKYNFAPTDLLKLVKMLCLIILVKFLNSLKSKEKNKNKDNINSDVEKTDIIITKLDILEKTIVNLLLPEDNREFSLKRFTLIRFLDSQIEKQAINLGAEVLDLLRDKIIYIGSQIRVGNNERTPYTVRLINETFLGQLPSELPCVYLENTQNIVSETAQPIIIPNNELDGEIYLNIAKEKEKAIDNYYISGDMHDDDIFRANQKTNKFSINASFCLVFFKQLFEIQEKIKDININLSNLEEDIKIPLSKQELTKALNFCGQLYEVNLNQLFHNAPNIILRNYILYLLKFALTFTEFESIVLGPKEEKVLQNYFKFFKNITDKIQSKRIIFNQIFYQITIMCNIKYFFFSWFSDSRGRKQMLSLLTLQNMPILRCFVEFSDVPTILEYVEQITNNVKLNNNEYHELIESFIEEYKEVYLTKLAEIMPYDEKKTYTLMHCCELSIGKGFLFYVMLGDYLRLLENPHYCKLKHPLGYDATNSGLQMLAILFKNYTLAKNCNLVGESKDVYNEAKAHIDTVFQAMVFNYKKIKNTVADNKKDFIKSKANEIYYANDLKNSMLVSESMLEKQQQARTENIIKEQNKEKSIQKRIALYENWSMQKNKKTLEKRAQQRLLKINPKPNWLSEQNNKDILWLKNKVEKRKQKYKLFEEQMKNRAHAKIQKKQQKLSENQEIKDYAFYDNLLSSYAILEKVMENPEIYNLLVSRAVCKSCSMTKPYGSTLIGARTQMLEKVTAMAIKKGIWLDKTLMSDLYKVSSLLHRTFTIWYNNNFKNAMALYEACKYFYTKNNTPFIFKFSSKFFTFQMYPLNYEQTRVTIKPTNNARPIRTLMRIPKNGVDQQKLQQSTTANFIQFMDATVISLHNLNVYTYNQSSKKIVYSTFTNHDCFYVPSVFILQLRKDVSSCYKTLFKMDLLDNFKQHPQFYEFLLRHSKEPDETPKLTEHNLCENPNFIK